jgi:hypothetical protein
MELLLDSAFPYLASPTECEIVAHDTGPPASAPQVQPIPATAVPLVALAFNFEGRFGQITYMWVYQGSLKGR